MRNRLIEGAAAGVLLGFLLVACESASGGVVVIGGSSTGTTVAASPVIPRGQLTVVQARQEFASWLGTYKAAMLPYSATGAYRLTTGQARQISMINQDPLALAVATVGDEQVIVPIQAGYPRWFLGTANYLDPPFSDYYFFVLTQAKKGGPWQAAIIIDYQGGPSPASGLAKIALDRDGYASQVPLTDSALAVPPGQLSADYARVFNAGPQSAQTNSIFPPKYLTFFIRSLQTSLKGSDQRGWIDSASESAAAETAAAPAYALRLTGGGAAVLFVSRQTTQYLAARRTVLRVRLVRLQTTSGVPLPPYFIGRGIPIKAGTRLALTDMLQFLVLDGPRGSLPVHVLAVDDMEVAFSPATSAALRSAGAAG